MNLLDLYRQYPDDAPCEAVSRQFRVGQWFVL